MLKWIIRAVLFKTILRRFWMFGILYAVARRFLPWEKESGTDDGRKRGYA